ncbi:MAG TPA: pilus assembly protein TadG-related protein [Blastococcus sp.]|jgi:Flp pilus assembly protein TadG|nr:pilus assembly protein TadG-related protein [Blastococcus sp.]
MQRLTSLLGRRLTEERGATAVIFALLLVPMLGFAAIAVDIGSLYADRAQLQTAADAAALAVARDCALGNCGDMLATASSMVLANDPQGNTAQPVLGSSPLSVTVAGSTPQKHWFAPVLGHDSTAVSATATVAWGGPSGGTAMLPLTFSWCEFAAQTGGGMPSGTTERTIVLPKKSDTGCTGPSHNVVPGGFGWLVADPGTCHATSKLNDQMSSEPGNNPSKGCSPGDLSAMVGHTVLLPIFDDAGGNGSHAWYHVYAYAAFKIAGYYFAGQYSYDKPCSGSARCISGYFTRVVDLGAAWSYSPDAPNLGSSILRLIR